MGSGEFTSTGSSQKCVELASAPKLSQLHGGESAYMYEFKVHQADGTTTRLHRRYSTVRRFSQALRQASPSAAAQLPPFPGKRSLSRQTPLFLLKRGEGLAAYLDAGLRQPALASRRETQHFLQRASTDVHSVRSSRGTSVATSVSRWRAEAASDGAHTPLNLSPNPPSGPLSANSQVERASGPAHAHPASRCALSARDVARTVVSVDDAGVAGAAEGANETSAADAATAAKFDAVGADGVSALSDEAPLLMHERIILFAMRRLHVLLALALAYTLGRTEQQPLVAVLCCAIGLVAGATSALELVGANVATDPNAVTARLSTRTRARARASAPNTSATAHRTASGGASTKLDAHGGASQGDGRATDERERGAAVASGPSASASAADGAATALQAAAAATAREGVRILSEALALRAHEGWRKYFDRDGVGVWVNSSMGAGVPMASLGVGTVARSPLQIQRFMSDLRNRPAFDKMWIKTEVLHDLPPSTLVVDGWTTDSICVEHTLFKSPAPMLGIAPRESVVVCATLICNDTGSTRHVQRSIDLPNVPTTAGYVRMNVLCGGFELKATSSTDSAPSRTPSSTPSPQTQSCMEACMQYLTVVDPCGRLPKSVVSSTMPDRAMTVARVRAAVP